MLVMKGCASSQVWTGRCVVHRLGGIDAVYPRRSAVLPLAVWRHEQQVKAKGFLHMRIRFVFTQMLCQFSLSIAAVCRIRRTGGLSSTAESLQCPVRRHRVSRHTRGDLRQSTPALHNTSTRTPTYNTQGWSTVSYLVGFCRSFSALGWPAHVVYQIWSGLLFDFSSMFMFTQHCMRSRHLLIVVLCSTISGDYSFLAVCGVD